MDKKGQVAFGSVIGVFLWVVAALRSAANAKAEVDGVMDLLKWCGNVLIGFAFDPFSWLGLGCFALVALAFRNEIVAWWHGRCPAKPAFSIRPIHGESTLFTGRDCVARLAIKNNIGAMLKGCSVRLVNAFRIMNGHVMSYPQMYPSISQQRGESFLLRWSEQEPATADRKYLDIPPDGMERIAEILIADQSQPGLALFTPANPDDLRDRCIGIATDWWKIDVCVASEDAATNLSLVAACGHNEPGPITLDYWSPRGEQILNEQRRQHEGKRNGIRTI